MLETSLLVKWMINLMKRNGTKRSKIARRLSGYFFVALLLFALILGSLFALLFTAHTKRIFREDLENRATSIAKTAEGYVASDSQHGMGKGSYTNYLSLVNAVSLADVWIVDQNQQLITPTHGMSGNNSMGMGNSSSLDSYTYEDLPPEADTLVSEVFAGKTAFSENFSGLLHEPTLTVGAPIKNANGEVVGVVLLHSPMRGYTSSLSQSLLLLLLSVGVALLVATFVAARLSARFTKPLNVLQKTALEMASGNYAVHADISQDDEIGDVAQAMETLSTHLTRAQEESNNLENMRREFIASVSHELRTPITVLRGSVELLKDGVVTEEQAVAATHDQILHETMVLERLVGDLFDLSTLQNANFAIEQAELNLCDVIVDAVGSVGVVAQEKQTEIVVDGVNEPYIIVGDYGRLYQMVVILLDNAVKFSPRDEKVLVALADTQLTITNHGVGIPEEDIPFIFDRFYRSEAGMKERGTGIGLSIAQEISLRHNMEIAVQSDQGVTTFSISLPSKM